MSTKQINLIQNKNLPKMIPVKEKMNIYVPGIIDGISRRNGMINVLCGSGGSGKTNLLLNMFKSNKLYRHKFNNIYYICPSSSFSSVEKHPFANHDKVYHELDVDTLEMIYAELNAKKQLADEEDEDVEYSCVVIDDMADSLKDKDIQDQMNKMLIKSRHLCCSFIFTLQSYYYFPKILRKQITYITIFKPNNAEEWLSLTKEILHMNKEDATLLYKFVFDAKYNHLDIDTREDIIYKNFHLLEIV